MLRKSPINPCLAILVCIAVFSCGKKETPAPAVVVVPLIKVDDATSARTTAGSVMHFNVGLDKTTTVPVSIDYTLSDGTATAARDYTTASGTITIPANSAVATIDVQIKGDATDTRQNNIDFTVNLSNPKACQLGAPTAKGTIITENGTNLSTSNTGYLTPDTYPGLTLVWSDEFNGTAAPSSTFWNFEQGNGSGGWGNNEKEFYTNSPKNVFQSNGNLIIEARKEAMSGFDYTSARMTTQGKKTFTYGRIDIRAKLPVSKGIWPALWMLGSNITTVSWPACGEIDIMELIGTYPSRTYSTMHWAGTVGATSSTSKGNQFDLASGNFSDQFHVFSLVWAQDLLKVYVDDKLFQTVTKADVGSGNYPFNLSQFLIMNVAVGGNWPGNPDAGTPFPQRMFVDYVRVFQ
jgi:beta-glucanase (GH16 family)